jgi:hypothetical protein
MKQATTAEVIYCHNTILKVKNCLCPDGLRRVAVITGRPDTWFSTPARVQARGKSVSGFITGREKGDVEFIAYSYRKNCEVFTY